MKKKVSIIIPCYNQAMYVGQTIESALAQTYSNIEIIIINDCSTDNSSDVIKQYAEKYNNILFLDEVVNKGVVTSRNIAIDAAQGEYILPLDGDDTIEPTYIEKAAKILDENANVGIVYCKAQYFGLKTKFVKLPTFDKEKILFNNCIFCSALFRKKDFYKAGKYKAYMQNGCEDWDLWLSFIELGFDVYQIDEILFNYRKYEQQSRSDHFLKHRDKVLANLLINHSNLYLTSQICQKRVFGNDPDKVKKKFKKGFFLLLPIVIIEAIIIGILTIILFK